VTLNLHTSYTTEISGINLKLNLTNSFQTDAFTTTKGQLTKHIKE